MEILHLMVPIAIILVVIAIVIFFWAVRSGQFDDLERQGYNILLDDAQKKKKAPQKSPTPDQNEETK
ncbi:MAG: cbb3-type cytochrome oxidase assembly protein CcoS [Aliidiomarina sp.]|uniref:cbb3-type cytochrome oxidase assembly protein CcoS n=1 Tax=Aliidiomarina sp. TaxID=1872439 RepID=UPI0025C3BE92|nr:cbb3-type cytochrome oxidase assembly protein CcoS [Aliidiomarina sp.]MCH8500280.1 cbb3-type cytochrome oxidase assembly protein CcoS [Aliidiomarina sp.]